MLPHLYCFTAVDAHKEENRVNVKVNLTLKQKHFRKYPQLTVGDKVKKSIRKELAIIFREKKQTADGVIKSLQ